MILESHVCTINYHQQTISRACDKNINFLFCFYEILEVLQSSRCSRMEQSLIDTEDSGIYQNLNETCKVRDVNDILGPLPQVPYGFANDKDWSRRASAFSGIYEEIVEPSCRYFECFTCCDRLYLRLFFLDQGMDVIRPSMKK